MSAPDARIRISSRLTNDEIRAALALADESARVDGAYPLSEHVVLHLRHGGSDSLHLLAEQGDAPGLLGYAHLDISDASEGPSAELAVSPSARRRGLGGMLVEELVRQAEAHPGRLRLWAHGADAAANELAASHGFHRVRRLWQLRRSLFAPLDAVDLPAGITLRSFDAQRDVADWLALNAAAFTDLPDQGGWTRADLEQRMAEPWFDPDGFLMAEARRSAGGIPLDQGAQPRPRPPPHRRRHAQPRGDGRRSPSGTPTSRSARSTWWASTRPCVGAAWAAA